MNPLPSFAAALLPANAEAPRGLHGRNRSDAGQRFAIHRNNVMSSLVRALEDGFPVTRLLVGEEFFRAMARDYVRAQPPRSPVLLEYGAGLPACRTWATWCGWNARASMPSLAPMQRACRRSTSPTGWPARSA